MATPSQAITSSDELFKRNEAYLPRHKPMYHYKPETFTHMKRMIIVTCMDQRVIPEDFLNLSPGEIPVVRCSGGRPKFAINDIAVLTSLIGLTEIVLIHHKDCGLVHKTDDEMRSKLEALSKEEAAKIDWDGLALDADDLHKTVKEDVAWLRAHPFIKPETVLTGCLYDIDTGRLEKIVVQ